MKTLYLLVFATSLATAQQTVNVGVTVPSEVATAIETYRQQQTLGSTNLSANINAAVTTATFSDLSLCVVPCQVLIGTELLNITAKSTNVATTMVRGAMSSVAAPHPAGSTVKVLKWMNSVAMMKAFIKDKIMQMLDEVPSAAITTQRAAIAAAQAAIQAEKDGAVQ